MKTARIIKDSILAVIGGVSLIFAVFFALDGETNATIAFIVIALLFLIFPIKNLFSIYLRNDDGTMSKKKKNDLILGIMLLIVIIIIIAKAVVSITNGNTDYVDYDDYQELNPQELHKDYLENEISAEEKYTGNYYYFTGTIYDIEKYLNDNYLEIRYNYSEDESKVIELLAYFKYNDEQIKTLKTGDEVTVYCKFKKRTIESYKNTITDYSFESCKLKED